MDLEKLYEKYDTLYLEYKKDFEEISVMKQIGIIEIQLKCLENNLNIIKTKEKGYSNRSMVNNSGILVLCLFNITASYNIGLKYFAGLISLGMIILFAIIQFKNYKENKNNKVEIENICSEIHDLKLKQNVLKHLCYTEGVNCFNLH